MKALLCLMILSMLFDNQSMAQQPQVISVAKWNATEKGLHLHIGVGDLLTKKQKEMIEGGFTTISQLTFFKVDANDKVLRSKAIAEVRCSVIYDAWTEEYNVVTREESNEIAIVKTFPEYANFCLQNVFADTVLQTQSLATGSKIVAELVVIQSSAQEEQKIKEWLISQQSGVMQTLFSHMLGELSLHHTLTVRISVPSIPESIGSGKKTDEKGKG